MEHFGHIPPEVLAIYQRVALLDDHGCSIFIKREEELKWDLERKYPLAHLRLGGETDLVYDREYFNGIREILTSIEGVESSTLSEAHEQPTR